MREVASGRLAVVDIVAGWGKKEEEEDVVG
jgi:hypothetical protein